MDFSTDKIPVLYIMGSGRSGSTVLDSILGNHEDIESVGELVRLPLDGWQLNRICACGQPAMECEFWSEVYGRWRDYTRIDRPEKYLEAEKKINGHSRRYDKFFPPNTKSVEFSFYESSTVALYKSIQEVSGKSIIVDSSKDPLRAFLLSYMPGIDLYLIHLVRDVRGVVFSYRKLFAKNLKNGIESTSRRRPVWKSSMDWLRINHQATKVCQHLGDDHSVRVKYEEFVRQPSQTMSEIGKLVGKDMSSLCALLEDAGPMRIGHTIAGNRVRMSGFDRLRLDEEWKSSLSSFEKWQVSLFAHHLMRKYEYTN